MDHTVTSPIIGHWTVQIRTSVGKLTTELIFAEEAGGIVGTARAKGDTIELRSIRSVSDSAGDHVTWHQSITKPLRLELEFDVVVTGNEMCGHSRAGRLPKSTVTGRRVDSSGSQVESDRRTGSANDEFS